MIGEGRCDDDIRKEDEEVRSKQVKQTKRGTKNNYYNRATKGNAPRELDSTTFVSKTTYSR